MKKKCYGITYARIYGLTSEMITCPITHDKIWEISFKSTGQPLPFDNILRTYLMKIGMQDIHLTSFKQVFYDNNIQNEDLVAIIYDVITKKVVAIGKNKSDCWITTDNFEVKSFAKLGIKNCSLLSVL